VTDVGRRNVIAIMSEAFRRDHLAADGVPAPWPSRIRRQPFIETSSLDPLFAESAAWLEQQDHWLDELFASSELLVRGT
jgi:hypothetical protein